MRILTLLAVMLVLTACKQNQELPSLISPYRIDIQQGNVVTQEMVDKLKAGMTRSQVRFVLGSPLVTDMFHTDRWDYIYLLQRQGKPNDRRRLTVIFEGDLLLRFEGDVVLTDKTQEPAPPAPKPPATVAPAPKPAAAKPAAATPAPKTEAAKPAPPLAASPAQPSSSKPAAASAAQTSPVPTEVETVPAPPAEGTTPASGRTDAKPETTAPAAMGGASKAEAAASADKKDPPKRGMFGRMLDKIGF